MARKTPKTKYQINMKPILFILLITLLNCCSSNTTIPKNAQSVSQDIAIYPDFKDVTVPQNIAPLNFHVDTPCDEVIIEVQSNNGEKIIEESHDRTVRFDPKEWSKILRSSSAGEITFTPYLKNKKKWAKYNSFTVNVIDAPIDSFVTYRLIEPSFMSTGQIGLYQFNLFSGEESTIIRRCKNPTSESLHDQSCVNCHAAQKKNPQNKMFYYRGKEGGLILTYNGQIKKIDTKVEGMLAPSTYPAWHPTLPLIAFSTNLVYQDFPTTRKGKTEFYDINAFLILYDILSNETYILPNEKKQLCTNPSWSPDGEYLYYAVSDSSINQQKPIEAEYPKLKYNIARIKFDPTTKSFSEPDVLLNVNAGGYSATFPRISPDNRFLLVNISHFGASPHTHIESDLFALDIHNKKLFPCTNANSPEAESYHDFSSKANWFVFYSRREDGNYGRAYISYIDSTGTCTKPFQLPHKEPLTDRERLKLYNVIEFSNSSVSFSEGDFYNVIWNQKPIQAKADSRNQQTDGNSGATPHKKESQTDATTGASRLQIPINH